MKAVGEEARDAELGGIAGAFGGADLDDAFGGTVWYAEAQACGAAHEEVGAEAVDFDGGQGDAVGTEMATEELDFTAGERRGWSEAVDLGRERG